MLYTGYFAKTKQYQQAGLQVVSIAGVAPDFFTGPKYPSLAPDYKMFMSWKKGKIDNFEYTRLFKEKLNQLDLEAIKRFLFSFDKDVVLLCYERPDSFCHRHIVADWLEDKLQIKVDEYDQAIKDLEIELIKALQTHIYTKEELDKMFQTDTSKVLLNIGHNPPEGYFLLRDKDLNTYEYIYSLEDKEQYLADYGITLQYLTR